MNAGHHKQLVKARRTTGSVVALGLIALSAPGCEKPLFAPDSERSQYDRYDAIRGQSAPPYVEDEFGRRHPNLRGRLMTRQ